jgi:hypothetical protein
MTAFGRGLRGHAIKDLVENFRDRREPAAQVIGANQHTIYDTFHGEALLLCFKTLPEIGRQMIITAHMPSITPLP